MIVQTINRMNSRRREEESSRSKPMRVRWEIETLGYGEAVMFGEEGVRFNTLFLEEPTFYWGVRSIDPLSQGTTPLCTAVVTGYHQNDLELFTGADINLRVMDFSVDYELIPAEIPFIPDVFMDPNLIPPFPWYKLKFYLTFEGYALRTSLGT